jgi:hypothetical protein
MDTTNTPQTTTIIDRLYENNEMLLSYLRENGEYSLLSNEESSFPKVLLLAVASYFEEKVKQILLDFFQEQTTPPLFHFVKNKAIERQYHTFFNWKAANANQFFGLFGEEFKDFMDAEIKDNDTLNDAIRAFMEIGRTRNALVHENFATFPLQKTAKEIYDLYQQALLFLQMLPLLLRHHILHDSQKIAQEIPGE